MRILVVGQRSDTGFGTVTMQLAERFLKHGLDVRVIAENHRGEPVKGPLAGRIWPADMPGLPFGPALVTAGIMGELWRTLDPADIWQPDRVLIIADMSGLLGRVGKVTPEVVAEWMRVPVYHYCPIEGDNLPQTWREVWEMVRPVAMSEYGRKVIAEHIGRDVPMVYHGVNTDQFRPIRKNDPAVFTNPKSGERITVTNQAEAKAVFGQAGKRLVIRADRNATRKFYHQLIRAFAPVAASAPDINLLLHCQPFEPSGEDIIPEVERLSDELRYGGRIWFTGMHDTFRGLDVESLRVLYNAADIYVSTTGGEGFGLTLAESLACETPVISTGYAAETEVVGPGGILVDPLRDEYGDIVRFHSSYGMDWAVPDHRKFSGPMLELLNDPARRQSLGVAGRRHVTRTFSWQSAAAQFLDLFEEAHAVAA